MISTKTSNELITNDLTYIRPTSGKMLGPRPIYTNVFEKGGTSNLRYFSSTEAEIYFGDLYIDDVVEISFQVQQNMMPIFGYNSYIYDDIAVGSRMVQGAFAINFTRSNYLQYVIDTLKGTKFSEYARAEELIKDPEVLRQKSPLWGKSFDIWVSYGDAKQKSPTPGSSIVLLENVTISGCSQQLGIDGSPIMEMYTFLARDIKFVPVSTSNTSQIKQQKANDPFKISSMTFHEEKVKNKYNGVITIEYTTTGKLNSMLLKANIPNIAAAKTIESIPGREIEKKGDSIRYRITYTMDDKWHTAIVNYLRSDKNLNRTTIPMTITSKYKPKGESKLTTLSSNVNAKVMY